MVLDEPRDGDGIVHTEGFQFIYNTKDQALFNETLIDYKDSWYGEGFTVCSPASEPC